VRYELSPNINAIQAVGDFPKLVVVTMAVRKLG
jgi:hypothetical protein